jgi:undecaprenyl diphosphate synthase
MPSYFDKIQAIKQSSNTLTHLAIIMDGNRRWARQNGFEAIKGHKIGSQQIENIVSECINIGVKYLTIFAFSSENWLRSAYEVKSLIALVKEYLNGDDINKMISLGVRFKVIGQPEKFGADVVERIKHIEQQTAQNANIDLRVALSYGGRQEIVDLVKNISLKALSGDVLPQDVNEEFCQKELCQDVPYPDLLIRTGGEQRVSNFLLWQLAYAELYFTDVLWPSFTKENLIEAIIDYQSRTRTYGTA